MITDRAIEFIEDPETFCRLCQQLLSLQFDQAVILSPSRGPDGGRDATLDALDGRWVFQFKYIAPHIPRRRLFHSLLRNDLEALRHTGGLDGVARYVLVTNAALSRTRHSGAIDRVESYFHEFFPAVKLEIWHAPTLAAKVSGSSSLDLFFRNECLHKDVGTSHLAELVGAIGGRDRVERLKDVLAQLEQEALTDSSPGKRAHVQYVRRSVKRLVLMEDLTLMHRSGAAGCYGVDEGILHFGVGAYSQDEDFTFVLEGTRILAAQGIGPARGGWIQVVPDFSLQELAEADVDFLAKLLSSQARSGSRTFVVDSATSRRHSRNHDFLVVPGVGGLLYSSAWESCEILGPGRRCRELLDDFYSVRREAFEIRAGTSLEEIEAVIRRYNRGHSIATD